MKLPEPTCGAAIAFAMEAYEKGLLTKKDTGELELLWGSGSVGMSRNSEKPLRLRYQRREALAPAPSTKKSAPYDSKRSARTPRPEHHLVFTPDLNP